MSDTVKVELVKPAQSVNAQNEPIEITSVELRRPVGIDLMRAGSVVRIISASDPDPENPYAKAQGETAVEIKWDGMCKLIARCARVPVRTVEQMDSADLNECANVVMGFLDRGSVSKKPTGTLVASSGT